MLVPPPVPVTQPKVQNFRQSSGIRLAGCWLSVDLMRWSLVWGAMESSVVFVLLAERPFCDSTRSAMIVFAEKESTKNPLLTQGKLRWPSIETYLKEERVISP